MWDIVSLDLGCSEIGDFAWQSRLWTFGMLLYGDAIDECDDRGRRITGDAFLIAFNAAAETRPSGGAGIGQQLGPRN